MSTYTLSSEAFEFLTSGLYAEYLPEELSNFSKLLFQSINKHYVKCKKFKVLKLVQKGENAFMAVLYRESANFPKSIE